MIKYKIATWCMLAMTIWTAVNVYLGDAVRCTKIYGSILVVMMLIATCFFGFLAERGEEA